ncbi:B12-binding domain-containing radical SAM protein [Pelosinus baikalensis]|uniref:B12-binding domain-containing radical SAM protein n=1 Tax=Pelosinus baikalensis TaxID=2892015 RepID=A0ABS8HTK9_9FIRM|nr:radical SAM protein [Pelosinus baikalensis]MCC5466505.1 B12-binding domain-containing radical SAM protein [Pelosinus baikalensis]
MRLALISPKGVAMGTNEENKNTAEIYRRLNGIDSLKELMNCPNSPLLTIAALAEKYFDEIVYIDEEIENIQWDKYYDMVAMSFMTQQASRAFELAGRFKEKGTYLVCGGMHPTNSTEETLQYFDTVFRGEAEKTWFAFMEDFSKQSPKRIYENKYEIDMEDVPIPRYDLLKMDSYRTIPIQISRGCPHDCEFCASTKVYGPKYRHKSVEKVLTEIEAVKKLKSNPHIYFTDDNMLVNKNFSLRLLDELKGGGIRWMTHTDVSVADHEEILNKLFASGCRKIVIGFESVVPESLRSLEKWKYNRLSTYAEAIRKIQSYGVGVWGTFIVGLDNDDTSVFQRVIDFTLENNLYGAMISVPTPFPGSRFFSRLESDGRILSKHWGSYTLWNVVMKPAKMTVNELQNGFEHTLTQIYSEEATYKRMEYFKQIYSSIRRR